MSTAAIQKTIDFLAQQGGGTLIIPAAPASSSPDTSGPAAGAFLSGIYS